MINHSLAVAGYSQVMVHLSHFAVHYVAILTIEQEWFIIDGVSQGIEGYTVHGMSASLRICRCITECCQHDRCMLY